MYNIIQTMWKLSYHTRSKYQLRVYDWSRNIDENKTY